MTVANILATVCALDPAHPEKVTLISDVPITSAAYRTGVTILNGVTPLTISTGAVGTNPNIIVFTLSGGPANSAALTFQYNQSVGDWHNGSDVVSTFSRAITNASQVGISAPYPYSSITGEQLTAAGGAVTGTVSVDLNAVDALLTREYEPQKVDFGGTFGVSGPNPSGITLLQDLQVLKDGMQVKKVFFVTGHSDWAAVSASDWEVQIKQRIGNALANLRTIDASVTLTARSISVV